MHDTVIDESDLEWSCLNSCDYYYRAISPRTDRISEFPFRGKSERRSIFLTQPNIYN